MQLRRIFTIVSYFTLLSEKGYFNMKNNNKAFHKQERGTAAESANAQANYLPFDRNHAVHTYEKFKGKAGTASKQSFRVGTFNIRYSDTEAAKANQVIFKSRVDLLGIQEVRNGVKIDFTSDYTNNHAIQHKLRHGYFFQNLKISDGTDYGNGLLSRFDLLSTEGKKYAYREDEQRSFIQAELLIHGQVVSFYTTHFDVGKSQRTKEIEELFEAVEADEHAYKIICGDVNTEDYEAELGAFFEAGYLSVQGHKGQFYTSYEPGPTEGYDAAALDTIFVTPNLEILHVDMVNHAGASDHHLLYADLRFSANV